MIPPPLNRYKITLEYRGERFSGWQRQPGKITVQGEIEDILITLIREHSHGENARQRVIVHGSGRTDTGVHALGQVAHFDAFGQINCDQLKLGLNYFLNPKGACVLSIEPISSDFHARFSASWRSYRYVILNRQSPSVLRFADAWHISRPLDHGLMAEAAQHLVGHHDFSAFRDPSCQAPNPNRTIDSFEVDRDAECIYLTVKARAFLHRQVRIMVGTLKWFGTKQRQPDEILDILHSKKRVCAGMTAPANGLFYLGPVYKNFL